MGFLAVQDLQNQGKLAGCQLERRWRVFRCTTKRDIPLDTNAHLIAIAYHLCTDLIAERRENVFGHRTDFTSDDSMNLGRDTPAGSRPRLPSLTHRSQFFEDLHEHLPVVATYVRVYKVGKLEVTSLVAGEEKHLDVFLYFCEGGSPQTLLQNHLECPK